MTRRDLICTEYFETFITSFIASLMPVCFVDIIQHLQLLIYIHHKVFFVA